MVGRRAFSLVVSALCAVGAIAAPAAARGASIGGFSVRPAEFNPAVPATRAYFKLDLAPGKTLTREAVVTNSAETALTLRIDAVDGLTGVTSGAVYANRQDPRRGAATWVRPGVATLTIPAHSSHRIAFTVQVPTGARPGDHLAGLAFQNAHAHRSSGSVAITEIVRAVVGVEIRVPGSAAPAMRVAGVSLRALPGTEFPSVVVGLTDVGGLLCQPKLRVALSGAGGTRTVVRQLDTLLPGNRIPYPLPWPTALTAGRYTARVTTTHCGAPATFTGHAVLGRSLRGHAGAARSAARVASTRTAFPIWLVALVGVGGLGVGLAVSRRRRPAPSGPST